LEPQPLIPQPPCISAPRSPEGAAEDPKSTERSADAPVIKQVRVLLRRVPWREHHDREKLSHESRQRVDRRFAVLCRTCGRNATFGGETVKDNRDFARKITSAAPGTSVALGVIHEEM
jgi:hypothetical protein